MRGKIIKISIKLKIKNKNEIDFLYTCQVMQIEQQMS